MSGKEAAKSFVKAAISRADIEVSRGSVPRLLSTKLNNDGIQTLIDVGANEGQYAKLMRASGFRGRVVSYEPGEAAHKRLLRVSSSIEGWTVVRAGLAAEPGNLKLNISANSFSSSVLKMGPTHVEAAPESVTVASETIEVRTIAGELNRLEIGPAQCFLKVDTQGFELEVLRGCGSLLPKMGGLQLEMSLVQLYDNAPSMDDLLNYLKQDWQLWRITPGFSAKDGRMLQCDGIFFPK